ncbi:MAG: S41 family peptidase [Kofleriaceae bacterium]
MTRCLLALLVLAAATSVRAEPLPDRTERIARVGAAWAHVKYFHPYLAYKTLDWDAAFVAMVPKIEAATTVEQYRAAVQEMLGKLGDPVTRINDPVPPAPAPPPAGDWLTKPAPGVVVIDLAGFTAAGYDYVGFSTKGKRVTGELATAKVAVIDLHGNPGLTGAAIDNFVDALPAIPEWPLQRLVQHNGYRTQDGQTSGGYFSTFITHGALPAKPAPATGPSHVVFIADATTALPPVVLALQAAGRATIVAPGPLDEDAAVETTDVAIGAGLSVHIRIAELMWGPPAADVKAPAAELRTRAIALAKGLAGKPAIAKPRKVLALPQLRVSNDNDYADQPLPSRPLRLLAGIRIWAVLELFNPYRYLIGDWERPLREALPRLDAAADVQAYEQALRELAVRAGDGHINVRRPGAPPRSIVAVMARLVEGKLAITRIVDPVIAKQEKLAIGDVIETIDGKPTAAVMAAKRPATGGSTEDARDQRLAGALFGGDDGTTIKLGVRSGGTLRDVTLTRRAALSALLAIPSTAPHWKTLANNIGYVDLTLLTVPEVDAMFAALAKTRAIVFDMRGYPNGTAWSIAPRVNTRKAKFGAQFLMPLVSGDSAGSDPRMRFIQPIPPLPPGASIYAGKIVVLIDERAISQSEHTCLFLQETAGATFVGSPTAGANGDVTQVRLPGGLRMTFTGQEVRHFDGKQLQKVGIQPHILIRPTLAGLRAGKDELLDRALALLVTGK